MINHSTQRANGFTLIETVIYIGLFSIIFTGIFVSIYPIFTGAERLTKNVATEGETAFILAKIDYALSSTMIDSNGSITSPAAGASGSTLVLSYGGTEKYRFAGSTSSTYCVSPLICKVITLDKNHSSDAVPLNTQRVQIENFSVTHVAPSGGAPRYVDISFTANSKPVGPIRYYLHF
jgi:type II secretory pathway pseudopilin PulG